MGGEREGGVTLSWGHFLTSSLAHNKSDGLRREREPSCVRRGSRVPFYQDNDGLLVDSFIQWSIFYARHVEAVVTKTCEAPAFVTFPC